ncbi:hypothetical protein AAUPMC_21161, partial [Pasteurella multocida subsp. multocida str. Anand1_cattle]
VSPQNRNKKGETTHKGSFPFRVKKKPTNFVVGFHRFIG